MKKTKDYTGHQLRERLMEVSGIQPQSHHLSKKDDEMIDVFGLTYGELKKLIQASMREYFEETFDNPKMDNEDELELDDELQRIIDELDFDAR